MTSTADVRKPIHKALDSDKNNIVNARFYLLRLALLKQLVLLLASVSSGLVPFLSCG